MSGSHLKIVAGWLGRTTQGAERHLMAAAHGLALGRTSRSAMARQRPATIASSGGESLGCEPDFGSRVGGLRWRPADGRLLLRSPCTSMGPTQKGGLAKGAAAGDGAYA